MLRLRHLLIRNALIIVGLLLACPANASFGHHFSVTPHVYWGPLKELPSDTPSDPKPLWSCNTKNAAVLYPDSCGGQG